MKQITITLCLLILSSCQSYRAERKINKLKSWGYLKDSTIVKYDTIRGFTHDTFVTFDTFHSVDTIITSNNGIKVITFVKWKTREVRQVINQKDTIFEHKYTTKVLKEKPSYGYALIGFIFLLLLIGLLLTKQHD